MNVFLSSLGPWAVVIAVFALITLPQPIALQLRFLQTMVEVSSEHNTTTFIPLPTELIRPFLQKG